MKPFDALSVGLSGPHLIEASAGTGKTYAITSLYLRLLLERGLKVEQILVVTFTEAATAELKDRVRGRLRACLDALSLLEAGDSPEDEQLAVLLRRCDSNTARRRLLSALHGFDEAAIFTIHAFCMRMLKDCAFESGLPFDAALITSQQDLIEDLVRDFWVSQRFDRQPYEVHHIDANLRLATLRQLAVLAAEHPDIRLIPEQMERVDNRGLLERHQENFLALRELWQTHRPALLDLLNRAVESVLKRNIYKPDKLAEYFDELDRFFEPEALKKVSLPASFKFFTPEKLASGTKKGNTPPDHLFFEAANSFLSSYEQLEAQLQHLVTNLKLALVKQVWDKLPSRKETLNQLYFQDLLYYLDKALHGANGDALTQIIRKRFPAALIDEFQDTDEVQYRIFRRIFLSERSCLFLIGDPKQAIYAFRGADIHTYLQAAGDSQDAAFTMTTNWRSDPLLIEAINQLFGCHEMPFLFDRIGYPSVAARDGAQNLFDEPDGHNAPLQLHMVPKPEDLESKGIDRQWAKDNLPGLVADRIATLLAGGATIEGRPLQPNDIAVLVRKNQQAHELRDALVRRKIPCVLHGNINVFKTDEARELLQLLHAIAEPTATRKVKVALTTELLGTTVNDLHRMEEDPGLWEVKVRDFRKWREQWLKQGFIQMFRAMLADAGLQRRLFATAEGERRMTNLLHLSELLQEAVMREHLGPAGLISWLERQRQNDSEEMAFELRLESDSLAVQLVTIHRAKGLEYPVVLCPYAWESTRPRFADGALIFHNGEGRIMDLEDNDQAKAAVERESFAEQLRLLYVATTRAKHRLELYWGPFNGCGHSALAYLLYGGKDIKDPALKDLHKDEARLESVLRARCAESGGRWHMNLLDSAAVAPSYQPVIDRPTLVLPKFHRPRSLARRNSSFTQLTSGNDSGELLPIRDHDGFSLAADLPIKESAAERDIPLRDFSKGARAGIFFHEVLEHLDFTQTGNGSLERLVELELRKAGFDTRTGEVICYALREVLATPLLPGGLPRLDMIPNRDRLNELEFLFPVAVGENGTHLPDVLTPQRLASIFAAHPENLPELYPDMLSRLGFQPLRGYMKGYIDLVFRFQDRFYLVDYKSNYLGATYADYGAEQLSEAMADSHYYLQYHIYTVALHRYLQQRLPQYRYASSFGGVLYLFIKGMSPQTGTEYGVFFERPPESRIEALSALMGQYEGVKL